VAVTSSGTALVTLPADTATFTEKDGRTTVTVLVRHASQEHRDMHINSGMESALQEAMDHLEQVAASLG
jgi:hypothetical protein